MAMVGPGDWAEVTGIARIPTDVERPPKDLRAAVTGNPRAPQGGFRFPGTRTASRAQHLNFLELPPMPP